MDHQSTKNFKRMIKKTIILDGFSLEDGFSVIGSLNTVLNELEENFLSGFMVEVF